MIVPLAIYAVGLLLTASRVGYEGYEVSPYVLLLCLLWPVVLPITAAHTLGEWIAHRGG